MKYWNAFKGMFEKAIDFKKQPTDKWILEATAEGWNTQAFFSSQVWKLWLTRLIDMSYPKKDNLAKIIGTLMAAKLSKVLKNYEVKQGQELLLEMLIENDKAVFFLDEIAIFNLKLNHDRYFRSLGESAVAGNKAS